MCEVDYGGNIVSARNEGLFDKYSVDRLDGKPLKGGRCIVLEVGDPNAWPALLVWADTVEANGYVALAADVRSLVNFAQMEAIR